MMCTDIKQRQLHFSNHIKSAAYLVRINPAVPQENWRLNWIGVDLPGCDGAEATSVLLPVIDFGIECNVCLVAPSD